LSVNHAALSFNRLATILKICKQQQQQQQHFIPLMKKKKEEKLLNELKRPRNIDAFQSI